MTKHLKINNFYLYLTAEKTVNRMAVSSFLQR